jgi:CheY-like chemotaxis protein
MPPREFQHRVPRVVIVEDNPADAEMLRFAIHQTGVQAEIVSLHDGAQAFQYFGLTEPRVASECDLLLLDISLPTVSGLELLERIKGR